jgi:PilZ domain
MVVHALQWNPAKDEWLCVKCLRFSRHISKADAEMELRFLQCIEPAVGKLEKRIDNERRQSSRMKTAISAELVLRGGDVPIRATTADLSASGCYIENMFTLPIGAQVAITLWLHREKVTVQAIVKTRYPHFGNGIQFVEVDASQQASLEAYLGQK